jgi:hypothetical protein
MADIQNDGVHSWERESVVELSTIQTFAYKMYQFIFGDWILSPAELEDSSIYWAQLSRFHLETETESSLRNVLF